MSRADAPRAELRQPLEDWRELMFMPQFCAKLGDWFLEMAALQLGDLKGAVLDWTPPRREMLDPAKEINASVNRIRGGLGSRSQALRELGLDPEDVDAEIAADREREQRLGLVFTSDARNPIAGSAQTSEHDKDQDKEPEKDG